MMLAVLLCCGSAFAQTVNVTMVVKPPYSAYLDNYRHLENKAIVTLTNLTAAQQQVYLKGSLENETQGLYIRSDVNYKPSAAITLQPNQTRVITADASALRFLDEGNTITNASDNIRQNIVRTGQLPEGIYKVCVRAYDYNTNQPLSPENTGCATINITLAGPPQITYPLPGQRIASLQRKNINFNWTPPVGNLSGGKISYELVVVKVPAGQNPNDAVRGARDFGANNPTIRKQKLNIQSYVRQPFDLDFEPGFTYAIQVIAKDENNKLVILNDGKSEIVTFMVDEDEVKNNGGAGGNTGGNGNFTPITGGGNSPLFMAANLKGTLKYYYHSTGKGTAQPVKNGTAMLVFAYQLLNPTGNIENLMPDNILPGGYTILATDKTDGSGNFGFNVPEIATLDFKYKAESTFVLQRRGDLGDVTVTGKYRRVLRVLVDNNYLCQPEGFLASNTQDNMGTLYCKVKTATHTIGVKIATKNVPDMAGVPVYLLRLTTPKGIPADNGSPGNTNHETITVKGQKYIVLSKGQTGANGEVTFENITITNHQNLFDKIFVYPTNDENNTKYSVWDLGVYELLYRNRDSYGPNKDKQVDLTDQIADVAYQIQDYPSALYTPVNSYTKTVMVPAQPRIYGTIRNPAASVSNSSNNQGEAGVKLKLYRLNQSEQKAMVSELKSDWSSEIEQNEENMGEFALAYNGSLEKEFTTGADGKFNFKDLDVETSWGSTEVGYYRMLVVEKAGFQPKIVRIKPTPQSANGDLDFLKTGEAYNAGDIFIQPDGKLEVKLKDEENIWVTGNVFYYDPVAKQTGVAVKTDKFGKAAILAPTGKRKLVIYPDNTDLFMADTIDVNVPSATGKNDPLTVVVPFKVHRYHLVVKNKKTGEPVSGAAVKLINSSAIMFDELVSPQFAKEKQEILSEASTQYNDKNVGNDFAKNKNKTPGFGGPSGNGNGNSSQQPPKDKYTHYTNAKGGVDFAFKNAATSFDFLVTQDDGEYVATIKKLNGNPSKIWKTIPVDLSEGRKVTGVVMLDKAPIKEARVRVDLSAASSSLPKIEYFTDGDGKFELHNVPIADANNVVKFTASKPGFIGDEVKDGEVKKSWVEVAGKKTEVTYTAMIGNKIDFRLTTYNDINLTRLMNFPIEITALKEPSGNKKNISVSGLVTVIPDNETFTFKTQQQPITFTNLEIVADTRGTKDENGKPFARPASLPMKTVANNININIFGYEGMLKRQGGITLDTLGTDGAVKGNVELSLSSFNVNNLGLNNNERICLADKSNNKISTEIATFTGSGKSAFSGGKKILIVNQMASPLKYKLYNFDVSSNTDSSFLTKDKMTLYSMLTAKLANANNTEIKVPVGNVTVTKNNLAAITVSKGFEVPLDSFRLQAEKVTIDNSGVSFSGKLLAAGMQIPYKDARLEPTSFAIPDKSLDAKNIKLLGVKPLKVNGNASFGYEQAKKAWVLSITGDDAAAIEGLDGLPSNTVLPLSSVYLYSNGDYKANLGKIEKSYKLHNIVDFTPSALLIHEKFFELPGTIETGLPNFKAITTSLLYEKSGNTLAPLKIGPGAVEDVKVNGIVIKVDQKDGIAMNFSPGTMEMKGAVSDEKPDIFSDLRYTLTKRANGPTELVLDQNPKQSFGVGGKNSTLKVTDLAGKMSVENPSAGGNPQWNYLYIEGDMPESMGFKPDKRHMRFDIKGNMEVNKQEIGVSNIETPFGDMNMKFDFPNKRLTGQLNMQQSITSGTSLSGLAQMVFDPKGFYLVSGGTLTMQSPDITGKAGVLIGNYPSKDPEVANILMQNSAYYGHFHQLPNGYTATTDIKGFFLEASASMPPPVIPTGSVDIGLVSAKLEILIGGDARMGMNFSKKNTYNMGFALFADAEFELSMGAVVACAGINVQADAWLDLDGTYESNGNWLVKAQGDITLKGDTYLGGGLCTSRCTGKFCAAKHLSASMTVGATGTLSNSNKEINFYFK